MNPYANLTIVRDRDGFVVGRPGAPDFVAVPDLGGQVLLWLQAGDSLEACEAKAAEIAGEWVDVADFLKTLETAGVLRREGALPAPRGQSVGRMLFGRAGVLLLCALTLTGGVLLVTHSSVRPTYLDAFPVRSPLGSLLAITSLAIGLTVVHELAHKLAAARAGIYGRISVSRRLYFVVAQTDLTGLWGVERRRRVIPLIAGLLTDMAIVAAMLIVQIAFAVHLNDGLVHLVRAIVFVNIGALVAQTAVYMRTDLYALLLVASGLRNLWATKGAVARHLIRRATEEDHELLTTVSRREIVWARFYLALYLPGIILATWYYMFFTLRATLRLVRLSLTQAGSSDQAGSVVAGIVVLILVLVPTSIGLFGALRAGIRIVKRVLPIRHSAEPHAT